MKTPTDPILASFVALLCKIDSYHKADGIEYTMPIIQGPVKFSANAMFENKQIAPIIRHLIEEEMERREYKWEAAHLIRRHYIGKFVKRGDDMRSHDFVDDKSKTRAVALAAYRTGER